MTKAKARKSTVKCRSCYEDMVRQLTLDGGEEYMCLRCGKRWPIPRSKAVFGERDV